MKMKKFERKVCPPIKDKRPKGMRSVPAIGYALMQVYARQLEETNPVDTALKEMREEDNDNESRD
jgi:hypothetical protein